MYSIVPNALNRYRIMYSYIYVRTYNNVCRTINESLRTLMI